MKIWEEASSDDSFKFNPYANSVIEKESPRRRHSDCGGDGQSDCEDDEQIVTTSTNGLLFVHQTRDQKRLVRAIRKRDPYAGRYLQDHAV